MNEPLELPEKVRRTAAALGAPGEAWIAALPELVAEVARDWHLSVGAPVGRGSESFVVHVTLADGEPAILKLAIPGVDPNASELRILQLADGRGYARLIRCDRARGAMLLERLGPMLADLGFPIEAQIETICATLAKAWRAPPPGERFTTAAEKAEKLSDAIQAIWRELDAPGDPRMIETALAFAEARRRAFDPAEAVLAHGDAHAWNTLATPENAGVFKFVDPDGLVAERAYDLAISMREWPTDHLAGDPAARGRERCRLLAALSGIEPEPIWQWAFLETLHNGLDQLRIGLEASAREFLAVAEAWAAAEPS